MQRALDQNIALAPPRQRLPQLLDGRPEILHCYCGNHGVPWHLDAVLVERGFRVLSRDWEIPPFISLIDPEEHAQLRGDLRAGRFTGLLIDLPCETRSRARNNPGGPPPLASFDFPYGRPDMPVEFFPEWEASEPQRAAALELISGARFGGAWSVWENPGFLGDSPSIYILPEVDAVMDETGSQRVSFVQGVWARPVRSPQRSRAPCRICM